MSLNMIKRLWVTMVLGIVLSGCAVIPDGGEIPTSGPNVGGPVDQGPSPVPGEPSANALPAGDQTRHRIALLVPLSGDNQATGQAIANATTMALLDTNASNLRITTYDTARGAGSAAARAVAEGNQLILGPLLGENVLDVLAQARPEDVPLISFSNDINQAERDAFVLGVRPDQSIERSVDYAVSQGRTRFAALIPTGQYGRQAELAYRDALSERGVRLVALERYDRGNTSVVSAANRLATTGGYDAVLIADTPRLAAQAAAALGNRSSIIVIGTELWSGDASVPESRALDGAWFSAVSDERFRRFFDTYRQRFGEAPPRIATLGYDAVLLTLRVARDWRPGDRFPIGELSNEDGFIGLDGAFRFERDGVGERALEVRQVSGGSVRVISPAPERF